MTPPPTLSVIVVSYNTRRLTLDCLHTLFNQLAPQGEGAEVIVVDNASSDGSPAAIARAFPAARLLVNAANLGFGAANNLAMCGARGRYFLLLNSDAFPHAGCLEALIDLLESHPEVGLVGPRLVNADGSLQRSCWPFPSPARTWGDALWITPVLRTLSPAFDDYRRWPHDTERTVDFVIGACLLVRREVYEKIGGFDERFFVYQEETDWQLRARQAGWRVMFTPAGTATHLAGGSSRDAAGTGRVFFESRDRYILKHFGRRGFVLNRAAQIVGGTLRALCWAALTVLPGWRDRARRECQRQWDLLQRALRTGLPA